MVGTTEGGRKAAITIKLRNGEDFYSRIGTKGGSVCCSKGFAANPELAKKAGAKGGSASKRGPAKEKK